MSIQPENRESMAEEMRSQELLSGFARGDDEALGELFRRESPRILRRLRARMPRSVSPRLGASDVLQLTAADLIRMRGKFENMGMPAFRELVATIADRTLAQALKRENAQRRTPANEADGQGGDGTSGGLELRGAIETRTPSRIHGDSESLRRIQCCIARLPAPDREVMRLLDYEELSCAEAAGRLGITVAAVHKRHSRAIARLRQMMRRE